MFQEDKKKKKKPMSKKQEIQAEGPYGWQLPYFTIPNPVIQNNTEQSEIKDKEEE